MAEIKLTFNEKRRAWYKWHPYQRKTVFVAGNVSVEEAMAAWLQIKDQAKDDARKPPKPTRRDDLTLGELVNRYLNERREDVKVGTCGLHHYNTTARALAEMVRFFGRGQVVAEMTPDVWTRLARHQQQFKPSSRKRTRAIITKMFRHAEDDDWIDRTPKFGSAFKGLASLKGSKKVAPFSREDCQKILAAIDLKLSTDMKSDRTAWQLPYRNLKAVVLLGLNGGLTPADYAHLRTDEVASVDRFIRHTRPKTDMPRVIPLWAETLKAIREAQAVRPTCESPLLLVTKTGKPLAHQTIAATGRINLCDSVSNLFRDVAKAAGVGVTGKGLSRLRHTCRSVASASGDETAADLIAGHQLPGMRKVYVSVTDDRLRRAADHVHDWLFTPQTGPECPVSHP